MAHVTCAKLKGAVGSSPITPDGLAATGFFQGCDAQTLQEIVAELEPVHLPNCEALFRQGERGAAMYWVIPIDIPSRLRALPTGGAEIGDDNEGTNLIFILL